MKSLQPIGCGARLGGRVGGLSSDDLACGDLLSGSASKLTHGAVLCLICLDGLGVAAGASRLVMAPVVSNVPVSKVRVDAFTNVIVSDVSAKDEVTKIMREEKIPESVAAISRGNEIVIYCKSPDEAGRLKMRLQEKLEPLQAGPV